MPGDPDSKNLSTLRKRAELSIKAQTVNTTEFSLEDARRLIHELQVYQIELELQNEDLRLTQLELELSRQKYIDLYEFSPVGLLTLDQHEQILETNHTFTAMLGTAQSDLLAHTLSDFIDRDSQDIYHFFFQGLRRTQQPQQCEIRFRSIRPNPLIVKLEGVALTQQEVDTHYRLAVVDITLQKQAEVQQAELTAERQRVKILADFIRDTSHDFRTPITNIITGLYLVGKTADKETQLKKIEEINGYLFYLTHVLDQLQQMAVLDSTIELAFQLESINPLVRDIIYRVQTRADTTQVTLTSQLEETLPKIHLSADKLERVLTNLLDNAFQFTPPGGTIRLMTQQEGNWVIIEVSDTGTGIDGAVLPHIFERFFKADQARSLQLGGAGLGLPMAKRIVELHHGIIEVTSTPGIKTAFRVKLPID